MMTNDSSSSTPDDRAEYPGLGRLWYFLLFMALFGVSVLLNQQRPPPEPLVFYVITGVPGAILAYFRFSNAMLRRPGMAAVAALLPLAGAVVWLLGLIIPPGYYLTNRLDRVGKVLAVLLVILVCTVVGMGIYSMR